jgi:hypothetical protein
VPEENEDKGCCSISTDLLKVDLDFCNTVVLKAVIANASCTAPVWGVVPMPKLEEGDEIIHTDPPLEPRGLLVAHQQWLI